MGAHGCRVIGDEDLRQPVTRRLTIAIRVLLDKALHRRGVHRDVTGELLRHALNQAPTCDEILLGHSQGQGVTEQSGITARRVGVEEAKIADQSFANHRVAFGEPEAQRFFQQALLLHVVMQAGATLGVVGFAAGFALPVGRQLLKISGADDDR